MTQDCSPKYWLRRNFTETLSLSTEASEWLIALWEVIQLFDDIADGGDIDRDDLDAAIWNALIGMPSNGFYQRNAHVQIPLMGIAIFKWKASDTVERDGNLLLPELGRVPVEGLSEAQAKDLLLTLEQLPMLNTEIALQSADHFRALRKRGVTVRKTVDVLIATFCIAQGLPLLHADKDFEPFHQYLGLKNALPTH